MADVQQSSETVPVKA